MPCSYSFSCAFPMFFLLPVSSSSPPATLHIRHVSPASQYVLLPLFLNPPPHIVVTRSPVNICSPRGRAQPGGWIAGSRINSLSPISAHASGHSAYQRWLSLLRPRLALRERERDTEVERGRHSMPNSYRQPEVFSLLIGGKICRSSLLVRKCVARLWLAWYGVTCLLLGGNLPNLVALSDRKNTFVVFGWLENRNGDSEKLVSDCREVIILLWLWKLCTQLGSTVVNGRISIIQWFFSL